MFGPWLKIRPFLDAAKNAFLMHYVPGQNLILDESMIEMTNRSCFIQYMPYKCHAKFAIKKFEVIKASTMYVFQMAVYSGKDYLAERPRVISLRKISWTS